jgi:hypothetical protein
VPIPLFENDDQEIMYRQAVARQKAEKLELPPRMTPEHAEAIETVVGGGKLPADWPRLLQECATFIRTAATAPELVAPGTPDPRD